MHVRRRLSASLVCILLLILVPAAAHADEIDCGSGSAAVNEYCETIPTPAGPQSTVGSGSGGAAEHGQVPLAEVLSSRTLRRAVRSKRGRALLRLPGPHQRIPEGDEREASVGSAGILEPMIGGLVIAILATGTACFAVRRRHPPGA